MAAKVQQGGRSVRPTDIERARRAGASDTEIHDAVLIAAAFCMFNRYVDGLATWAPTDPEGISRAGRVHRQAGLQRRVAPDARRPAHRNRAEKSTPGSLNPAC